MRPISQQVSRLIPHPGERSPSKTRQQCTESHLQQLRMQDSILAYVQTWYHSLPLCTKIKERPLPRNTVQLSINYLAHFVHRAVFTLMVAVYLMGAVFGTNHVTACLSAYAVVTKLEVGRLITSVATHSSLLHIAFNMLAFVPLGRSLESAVGTCQFLLLILLITVLEGIIYVAAACMLSILPPFHKLIYHCAVGFSGVIFGLIVIDNSQAAAPVRSIFGLFTLPAQWYPWVLLVAMQLIVPSASFLGHLSGLLVGELWVGGYLKSLQPPRSAFVWLDSNSYLSPVTNQPTYVSTASTTLPYFTADVVASRNTMPSLGPSSGPFTQLFSRLPSLFAGNSSPEGSHLPSLQMSAMPTTSSTSGLPAGAGSSLSEVPIRPAEGSIPPPRLAAAAAAEARASQAARAAKSVQAKDRNSPPPDA